MARKTKIPHADHGVQQVPFTINKKQKILIG